ncbi:MAG: DUF4912 domain-containing protein [Treponema sp.]|nr:DUF4912 domain-containing protein [Treponema sp.]
MTDDTVYAPFTRHQLDSLSTGELIKMAEGIGIDIPAGLERIFIIEELLENNDAVQEIIDDIEINPAWSESVPLPKQYNISYIDVIIRDPLWVFAHWEIKNHDREIHENADDFKGYFLRVIPLNEDETVPASSNENSFTVLIGSNDSARYLGFAEQSLLSADHFVIKLGAIRSGQEHQLAISQPFHLPRLIENDSVFSLDENPLIHLSGVKDLTTIKSMDRQSRNKRQ